MIINKSKPLSLSMRMRTEAAKLPPERGTIGGSASLPEIGIGTGSSSYDLKLSSTYSLTKSKKDAARQEIEVERASGIIDYTASGGVFADRTKMTMPNAVCVRCGEHASCCMSCTEFLAEEALNFYRKTRARGAAALFANAITQTGITVVVKYIVYTLWRNGFRTRKWSLRKRVFRADVMFRLHFMAYTFRAWAEYKNQNLFDRRDKAIAELEKRVVSLEASTVLANNLKTNAEAVLARNQKEKDGFLRTIVQQEQHIQQLQAALQAERGRVVGLASLTMPVLGFEKLADQLSENERKDIHRQLFSAAASQQPTFDYGKAFNAEDLQTVKEGEVKRRLKGKKYKAEDLDEGVELVEMLLTWASTKARDAGANIDQATGKPLDTILPKYKKAGTFAEYKDGKTLLRLVVGLMWDTPQPGHTTLKLSVSDGLAPPGQDGEEATAASPLFDHVQVLQAVKTAQKTPFEMISCAVEMAIKYLALPPFQVGDLIACRPEIYTALLGYLMLASASPAQSTGSLSKVSSLINTFEKASENAAYAKRQITLKEIKSIQKCWAELHGVGAADAEGVGPEIGLEAQPAATDARLDTEAEAKAARKEARREKREEDGEPPEEAEMRVSVGENVAEGQDKATTADTAILETGVDPESMGKYYKLAAAVDGYLNLLGEQDVEHLKFEKKDGPVRTQIGDFVGTLDKVAAVRASLNDHLQRADQGFRLATDARLTMARFQYELLVSELKWVE